MFDTLFNEFIKSLEKQVEESVSHALLKGIELGRIEAKLTKEQNLLTRKEAAAVLKVTVNTLDSMVKDGLIPSYRNGSLIRFKQIDLENSFTRRKY